MYNDFKKSGIIHKIIQTKIKENYHNFKTALDITTYIEENIKTLTKYNDNNPLQAGVAFPVGISINDVAAHFTPSLNNNPSLNNDDIIKIDFGVHINGCITDGAFSWCPSGKYNELIDISTGATNLAIKNSGPDAILGDIGEVIQEYIESKEIIVDNKIHKIKSIYDLCGHNIAPYIIHVNKAVPNIKINYKERMLEGEIFAIETFPTTGDGLIYESQECNHYMIESRNVKNFYNNKYLSKIFQDRSTLAFCPRWFNFEIPDSNYITKYPVLKTKDKSVVAQYEKTIYIKDNGINIIN